MTSLGIRVEGAAFPGRLFPSILALDGRFVLESA